jgi:hypothetical protein
LLNPGDVSAQPDHRQVDDGVDAARFQITQLLYCVVDPCLLIPVVREVGVVLPELGAEYENMLMHEDPA